MFITIAGLTTKNTKNNLEQVTLGRMNALTSYFDTTNEELAIFSNSDIVRDILKNPDDSAAQEAAQKYTEQFGQSINDLEGLYIANMETEVLVHTNKSVIGKITRPHGTNADVKQLGQYRSFLGYLEGNGMYVSGVSASKGATNDLVYSVCIAVYDHYVDISTLMNMKDSERPKPIGYVGCAIYTTNIVNQLPDPGLTNVEDYNYYVVNTENTGDNTDYDFNIIASTNDDVVVNSGISSILPEVNTVIYTNQFENALTSWSSMMASTTEYKHHVAGVTTFGKYKTAVILETKSNELYKTVRQINTLLIVFWIVMTGAFIAAVIITRRQEKFRVEMNRQQVQNSNMRSNLEEAIYTDILTDLRNRTAFQIDSEGIYCTDKETAVFGMIAIDNLSEINASYGNDTGDTVITKIANYCREAFKDTNAQVYRTGSGEFVIMQVVENNNAVINDFVNKVDNLKTTLAKNYHNTPAGNMTFPCTSIAAKKSKNLNASIVTIMKANIKSGMAGFNTTLLSLDT